jgi:predicted phage terminase large subunit-like protein
MKSKDERLLQAVTAAEEDLVSFRTIFLAVGDDECEPAPFHYEWSEILLHGDGNDAIEGFRESAKTQYVLRAFLQYAFVFPCKERDYIVLIKKNTRLAQGKLKEIIQEYHSNPLLRHNTVKIREQSGEVFSVDVRDKSGEIRNIRIEAYGKGSAVRGLANVDRRPKIVIIDDPQDLEDATSDTICESDWEWFLGDVFFLGQTCRIFIIGNNLGERCILERIESNRESLNFKFHRIPIHTNGVPAWRAKYTIEGIEKEKADYDRIGKIDIWLRERMCVAVGEENRTFNPDNYRYFNKDLCERKAGECNRFITLDPAANTKDTSCYRAMVVNAVDEDDNWFIVDVPYGRWDSVELIDMIFEKVVQWDVKEFGIEKGQMKDVFEPILYREMPRRNIYFNVVPIEHQKVGSKLERIKMLAPKFKSHTIWFPQGAKWLPEMKSELAGITKDAIKSLYIDLVDALTMQFQIAKKPYKTGRKTDSVKYRNLPRTQDSEGVLI